MTPTIRTAHHTSDYKVWIEFTDGTQGEIDLVDELWGAVFEPLRDVELFSKVQADPEADTITWPNGADFAPEFLYERVKARQLRAQGRTGELCPESGVWVVEGSGTIVTLEKGSLFPPHGGRPVVWRKLEQVG